MTTRTAHDAGGGDFDRAFHVTKTHRSDPLRECVREALGNYLEHLNGHKVHNLYDLVLAEVEKPLLETVMHHTRGNQTHAAALLGMSRSTLRKKLALYEID
ncbi:MAG: DNA-binding transcriptional regulator Fis [Gammaproteobacteria bacterium]|jgi:Fis family transcriptional regulator|nr:DNA-binding transcriptional regulator Fis [Gammaproteobacteria bacterium]